MKEGTVLVAAAIFALCFAATVIGTTVNVVDKRIDPKMVNDQLIAIANAVNNHAARIDALEGKRKR